MFSLQIDTARTWRGGQNQVLLTARGLRARGHRVVVVAHPNGELRKRLPADIEVVPLAPRGEVDLPAAWRLSRVIRDLQPDVIHAHDPARCRRRGHRPVDRLAAAASGARRSAPRRLPHQEQLVFALEVPPGRSLHHRVGRDSGDAR